ncbi:hypothetical protein H0H93_014473, partial [Arthromyces matolae]
LKGLTMRSLWKIYYLPNFLMLKQSLFPVMHSDWKIRPSIGTDMLLLLLLIAHRPLRQWIQAVKNSNNRHLTSVISWLTCSATLESTNIFSHIAVKQRRICLISSR